MRIFIPGIIVLLLFVSGLVSPIYAETMVSPNYTIRMGNFNMTSGLKFFASSYSLTDTVGQIAAQFFASTGYHVKAGFQYIYTLYDFSFSLSSVLVDLGRLNPNTLATVSHTLTVSAPGQGYSVTAYEVGKMTKSGGSDTISNTLCDSGSCDAANAGIWTSTSTFGFGYNVSGNDIPTDFLGSTYFRPFADISSGGVPATVMTSSQAGKNRIATVTYQANVDGEQASGTYSTQIIYIATPVY